MTTQAHVAEDTGLVQPAIRYATLTNVEPAPKQVTVVTFVDSLVNNWSALAKALVHLVESIFGKDIVDIDFADNEHPHGTWESGARVVETPRFLLTAQYGRLVSQGVKVMEGRVGAAFCTSGLSSKVFSRVRPVTLNPGGGASMSVDGLPEFAHQCRILNKRLAAAVFDWIVSTARESSVDFKITPVGELEVSALGIRDKSLSGCFWRLRNSGVHVSEMLKDPETDEKLSSYYRSFTGDIDCRLSELRGEKSELIWFSSPIKVEVEGGYLEPREVLYLLRGRAGVYQALGVAYDDSVKGNLALKSTNRVSRWLSNKM